MQPTSNHRLISLTLTVGLCACALTLNLGSGSPEESETTQKSKDAGVRDDWPMFGGTPARNMVNLKVKNLPAKWNIGKKTNIKWVADLGSISHGGPVVSGGGVFAGTNNQRPREMFMMEGGKKVSLVDVDAKGELILYKPNWVRSVDGKGIPKPLDKGILMSFAEKDGAFQWQSVFHKLPSGQVHNWPYEGLCSAPVIEGDKLYYVSNRCEVVCSTTTGSIQWKLDMMGKLGVEPHNMSACSPLIVGDKLWVVTSNGVSKDHVNVLAPKAPSFLALDKRSGAVLWQDNSPTAAALEPKNPGFAALVNQAKMVMHGQWSNPAYAVVDGIGQVVFPGGDGRLYSFDIAGKLLWKFDCNPKNAVRAIGFKGNRNPFVGTPVIHDNKVYIGMGDDPEYESGEGHLWCIRMDKFGDVSPELVVNAAKFPPVTKPNPASALVWHYGGAINNPKERARLKRSNYFGRTMSTCAVHDGLVYAAELMGFLHCLDAKTGQVYWTHDTVGNIWSSPYWVDNKIYLGNDSNSVFVFAHGRELKLLAENEMNRRVRNTAVAANGVLYVMTEDKLYAIAAK